MIKFEEHDGLIFKMLDKPVPLTPDAEMPCLVRLIQDDSPMGMYNKKHRDTIYGIKLKCFLNPIIAVFIDNDNIVNAQSLEYYRYEIIGTLVTEGSKEWALYRLMQGEKVCHQKALSISYYKPTHYVKRKVRDNCTDDMSIEVWLDGADPTGWQIYEEPKPLLAEAKEGWIVTNRAGHTSTIKYVDNNNGVLKYAYEVSDGTTIYVKENGMFNLINHNSNYDIISTEPLAPEGTAEWAWQMWCLLRKEIMPKNTMLTERALDDKYPMITYIYGHDAAYWKDHKDEWLSLAASCKWELSKPDTCPTCNGTGKVEKPKHESENIIHGHVPADMHLKYFHLYEFKVGDWLEFIDVGGRTSQGKYLSNDCDYAIIVLDITCNMQCVVPTSKIIRKLSPTDVVIHIGCLSGTVRPVSTNGIHIWFHLIGNDDRIIATIRISSLDTQTRELVESLIKAMEEEK